MLACTKANICCWSQLHEQQPPKLIDYKIQKKKKKKKKKKKNGNLDITRIKQLKKRFGICQKNINH